MIDNNYTCANPVGALQLMTLIYSDEIIKKWSHARTHKLIIETMTYSFVGKMTAKGLIKPLYDYYQEKRYYIGHYITQKGREYYNKKI